jgi:hypothetical protein
VSGQPRIIAYDVELRRPGCALLQAVYSQHGTDHRDSSAFPTESWLTAPTENLRLYEVTDDRFSQLVARAHAGDWELYHQDGPYQEKRRDAMRAQAQEQAST